MTTEPEAQNPVVEHLRAQNAELAAQLDHSRMANRGWREQMQEVQVTLSRTQQALGQANARIKELEEREKKLEAEIEATYQADDEAAS